MKEKAQVSVEFIIVVILLLALFLLSVGIFAEKNTGYMQSKEQFEARLVADKLAKTVNNVYLAGPGTEASLLLEKKIEFQISVSGNAVTVEWRDNYVDAALLTDQVTINSLEQGSWLNVKNVNGGIEIETA